MYKWTSLHSTRPPPIHTQSHGAAIYRTSSVTVIHLRKSHQRQFSYTLECGLGEAAIAPPTFWLVDHRLDPLSHSSTITF